MCFKPFQSPSSFRGRTLLRVVLSGLGFCLMFSFARSATPPTVEFMRGENFVTRTFNTTIGARVRGTGPLAFQWFKEELPLAGETAPSLTITNITQADAGHYHFVVSNSAGSIRSPMYALGVVPHNSPSFVSDERRHIIISASRSFSLNPLLRDFVGESTFQWFFNDQPLVGETEQSLRLRASTHGHGQYHLVATNAVGAGRTPYYTVDIGQAGAANEWTDHIRHENRVYFLLPATGTIRRYDLEQGLFLSDITLTEADNQFIILADKIYYESDGNSVRRVGLDGQGDELVYQSEIFIQTLFGWGQFLFVRRGQTSSPVRVDIDTLAVAGVGTSYWDGDFSRNVSVAPSLRRVFAVRDEVKAVDFDTSGIVTEDDSRSYGWSGFAYSNQAWVVGDETVLITSSGASYRTADLGYIASVGTVVDVDEAANGEIFTIHNENLVRFNQSLEETGRYELGSAVHAIATYGTNVFLFRQPLSTDDSIAVSKLGTFWFAPRLRQPNQSPGASPLDPSFVLQDKRGELLLINPAHKSVEIWLAAARGFTDNIRLAEAPTHATYSSAWDRLLLAYSDGRIMQLDLSKGTGLWEARFGQTPIALKGMVAAGNYLVTADTVGAWVSHLSYNQFGQRATRLEWGREFGAAAWSEQSQRIFHTHPVSSTLSATSMQTSGQLIRHDIIQSRFLGRNRTIVFNPSGNQVLLDSGEFINTHTLQPSNRLSSELDAAVWMGDRLFTAKAMARGVRVTRWGGTNYGQDAVIEAPGSDPHLFVSADGELILVTRAIDRTVFSLFDENLNPVFRQSHRGTDLLDDTVRLSNLSTRVNLPEANDNPLVVGFVIRGDSPMRVLLRAVGPGLAQFGIDDHVADPQIRVYDSSAEIVTTVDDWSAETAAGIEAAAVTVGAFPLEQRSGDAAIVLTLPPDPTRRRFPGRAEVAATSFLRSMITAKRERRVA